MDKFRNHTVTKAVEIEVVPVNLVHVVRRAHAVLTFAKLCADGRVELYGASWLGRLQGNMQIYLAFNTENHTIGPVRHVFCRARQGESIGSDLLNIHFYRFMDVISAKIKKKHYLCKYIFI